MIKGRSVIELTNHKTGKVRKYEDENLVTNAVAMYMQNLMAFNNGPENYSSYTVDSCYKQMPLYNIPLGGILLFDNTLEEDPNNIYIPDPTVAKIIGHASATPSADGYPTRGQRNLTASCEIENGYRFVYEFTTNQANGTIKSISLTNELTGYHGYSMPIGPKVASYNIPGNLNEQLFMANSGFHPSFVTSIKTKKSTSGGLIYEVTYLQLTSEALEIRKYIVPLTEITLNKRLGKFNGTLQETVTIPLSVNYNTSEYKIAAEDDYNYYLFNYYMVSTLICITINKLTHECTQNSIQTGNIYTQSNSTYMPVVRNGYIYLVKSGKKIVKYSLNNASDPQNGVELANVVANGNQYVMLGVTENGTILTNSCIIDLNDNVYGINPHSPDSFGNLSGCQYYKILNGLVLYRNNNDIKVYPSPFYLGTINNLAVPVTKTDQESMKITYELVSNGTYTEPRFTGYGNKV